MKIRNVVPILVLSLSQAEANPLDNEVIAKNKAAAISSCEAAYKIWYAENRGKKKISTGLRKLVTDSCTGRFFISSLKCSQAMFDAIDSAKAKGAKEMPPVILEDLKVCAAKTSAQSKEDIKLLADYADAKQISQLEETLKKWRDDGSLKYFKDR